MKKAKEIRVKRWKRNGHVVEIKKTDTVGVFYYLGYIDGKLAFAIRSMMLEPEPKLSIRKGVFNFDGHCGGVMLPIQEAKP